MYSEHIGDIFNTTADAIGHGVNNCGVMGSGIAKHIRRVVGEDYYLDYCRNSGLGGTIGSYHIYSRSNGPDIVNLYTQQNPGPNAEYRHIVSSLGSLASNYEFGHEIVSLALPRIGCGIGGLDWNIVREILRGFGEVMDIEVWELDGVDEGWNR